MTRAEAPDPLVPFPRNNRDAASEPERWLRPFGAYEADLYVELRSGLRPVAVTKVLANCLHGGGNDPAADERFLWDLPVGRRIEALMTLAIAWDGGEMELVLRCPECFCGQDMELDVTLPELAEIREEADTVQGAEVEIAGRIYRLRRPTGRDQLAWLRCGYADEEEAMRGMIGILAGIGTDAEITLGAGEIGMIAEAMSRLDPLVDFLVTVRCPHCGCEHAHAVDLEEIALGRLRGAQLGLISTVHRLAWHYKWSEREIFSVPAWRREQYLRLIEREKG